MSLAEAAPRRETKPSNMAPATADSMKATLDKQRAAYLRDGPPSAEVRIDRIDRCIALLVDHQDEIAEALQEDFGSRPIPMSKFTDVAGSIGPLKHAKANLRKWMKREKRKLTPAILGLLRRQGRNRISAARRRRRHRAVEFPGQPDLRAARRHSRGGQPRDDQAVGIHARDLRR